MARALYNVRWQVELLFKQLKSILRIHQSDTSKENRLRCELYGKLIGAVIIHRIHAVEDNLLWNKEQQEAIERYLSWRNGTRDISLENWKSYRRS